MLPFTTTNRTRLVWHSHERLHQKRKWKAKAMNGASPFLPPNQWMKPIRVTYARHFTITDDHMPNPTIMSILCDCTLRGATHSMCLYSCTHSVFFSVSQWLPSCLLTSSSWVPNESRRVTNNNVRAHTPSCLNRTLQLLFGFTVLLLADIFLFFLSSFFTAFNSPSFSRFACPQP